MKRIALALVFAVIAACAPPPPATDVDESTRVRVTAYDGKGYCIPDAGVWIERRSEEIAWRAWTDDERECQLRVPSNRWRGARVHVRTRDLHEGSAEYDGRAESLQIVVRPARAQAPEPLPIEGAVTGIVLSGGKPAGGVPVLLWRVALPPPSLDAARRALDGESIEGLQLTRSDRRGLFRFDVGERVLGWRVCAGGKGWASQNGGSSARTGEATKLHLVRERTAAS